MSRDNREDRRRTRGSGGYTLIETMVVVVMLASASVVMNMAVSTTQSADDYLKALGRATERGQRITFEVADLVSQSRRIFEDDEMGQEYLAALELGTTRPDTGARLPVIEAASALDVDTADASYTGNMLMFVREGDAAPAVADATQKLTRDIDTYRMFAIFPQQTDRYLFPSGAAARDLVIWRSLAYPSHEQLMAIGNLDQRKAVVMDLVERFGFTYAWDPREYIGSAFYALNASGEIALEPELAGQIAIDPLLPEVTTPLFVIPEDRALSQRGRLVYAGVQLAPTDPTVALRRAILTAEDVSVWAPNGFELKVSGPSGSRQVWIHVVVEVPAVDGRKRATQACTRIAHTRDF